ncbi:hypothetical protein ACIA6D_23210 [Streptomyces cacaoi]
MIRRIVRAVYWPAVILAAAVAMTVAPIPFTGAAASVASVTAVALVFLAGLACEPRKDGQ